MTNRGYHSDFFTPASRCEEIGGRLLWFDDVTVTDFIHHQLQELLMKTCESCSFLWIGLLQSVNYDNLYFWKRTTNETLKQCKAAVSTTKCFDNVNKTECELLGCCYRNQSCFYSGNTAKDILNEYVDLNTTIHPFHRAGNTSYRHCVGLQKIPFRNMWVLRTVDCKFNRLPENGFLCQYRCDVTVSVPTVKSIPIVLDKCSSLQSQCQPISGRNSCFEVVHSNKSSGWFESAAECEMRGGRLLWLDNANLDELIKNQADPVMQQICPNCTFMWIGLMQSIHNDNKFFWKRIQNETQTQCHVRPSNIMCYRNATKEECELMGCCFLGNSCLYPDNVAIDRHNEFHSLGSVNYTGNRRCVGISKNRYGWYFSINECSKRIPYEHGYFCEFQCGVARPGPQTSTQEMLKDLLSATTDSSMDTSILPTTASKMMSHILLDQTVDGTSASFTYE